MASDVEHLFLFIRSFANFIFSLVKCLYSLCIFTVCFTIKLLEFLMYSRYSFNRCVFVNISFHSVDFLFILLTGSFIEQMFLLWIKSYYIFLSCIVLLIAGLRTLHQVRSPKFYPVFIFKPFIILYLHSNLWPILN